MKRWILAVAAAVSLSSPAALAQGYWSGFDPGEPPRYGRDGYERGYGDRGYWPRETYRERYGYSDRYDRPRERSWRRYEYSDRYDRPGRGFYRQGRMGSVCVTARGDCGGGVGPINSPCECYMPGFGPKRGAIGY